MKPNRKYTNTQNLKIMGISINSNICTRMNIRFTIDARHIALAIVDLMILDEKITKKRIENRIKDNLFDYGENWYISPIDYSENGNHFHSLEKSLPKAIEIGKLHYPDFFGTENSIKFIMGK